MTAPEPRHVCLVTPGHLASNPRLVKEADALHEAGYRVSVVAARFVHWADEADREFEERPWSVHRFAFGPLAPRTTWLAQSLSRRIHAVLWSAFGGRGRLAEGAFHPGASALRRLAARVRADLYIAHNLAALQAAGRAARRHGGRLGFDAEDFHLGETPDGAAHAEKRALVRALEARWLAECVSLTAASPGIAIALVEAYGVRPPAVVLNVFPRRDAPATPQPPSIEPGPGLYWFSQTVGPHRGLETAVRAIARAASAPHLYLRGNPAPGFVEHLSELASQLGVSDRLHPLPPLSPGSLPRDAARFHLGFAGEEGATQNSRISLSNKIFTYLSAGLPAAVSSTPAQEALAVGLQEVVSIYDPDDPRSLARALDGFLLDRGRLGAARERAWLLGQRRYCWEVEQTNFLAAVEEALR